VFGSDCELEIWLMTKILGAMAKQPFGRKPVRLLAAVGFLAVCGFGAMAQEHSVKSPDGRIQVDFNLAEGGKPVYLVKLAGVAVTKESGLGIVREDADFTKGLKLTSDPTTSPVSTETVKDEYEILTAKRRKNSYVANKTTFKLQTADGKRMDIIFQVSNDGVAFRYCFPEASEDVKKITKEATSFGMVEGTKAFLQPMQQAKTGFGGSNPAYEEFYQKDIAAGTPSTLRAGWIFPALFHKGDTWLLLSEAGLGRSYCGTKLAHESPNGEYFISLADKREVKDNGPAWPESKLPWTTPWRLIVVGSLKTIAESTLGIDLADKATTPLTASRPGRASWSWPLMGDSNTKYDVQKQFIDYAAEMGWEYCLVDALWDKQIGYDKTRELCEYAATKKVGVLLWYNSAGDWNTTPQSPRDKMISHDSRIAEFDKLKAMGVKGLKIDFFGGDGQSMIAYYHDILQDAAPYGFLMNFHGATLPRGWQRTYPNLMTVEAIKGFEYITFGQDAANQEPSHAAMLPFTRNVFDPMDFTPVCLDRINNRVQRRTTSGFELALSVIFTSGIQHFPEVPQGMAKMPEYVKDFMRKVPAVWDDSKFLDGYPGKFVVMARQGGGKWIVAGINGEAADRKVSLDLGSLPAGRGVLITDGNGELFQQQIVELKADQKLELALKANGGVVITFDKR
jgi:alpha-glucosidase